MKLSVLYGAIVALIMGTNGYAMDAAAPEALSPKGQMVYENALKDPNYKVEWTAFDFKNQEDDKEATKVAHKLDAKFAEMMTAIGKARSLISRKTNDTEKVAYETLDTLYKQYSAFQQQTSDDWSHSFMGQ